MALVSPGVEVSVIDESAYSSAATGTVPLIILATGQDKTALSGKGVASGTTKANAGKLAIVSSQRELATLYGMPYFEQTSSGTPVHGGERNEYGLMAAYSMLGISNRAMTVRADVDLTALKGTAVRPRGKPADGIYWLDAADTVWGAFEWNAGTQSFSAATTHTITSTSNLTGGVPNVTYGAPGEYAIVATNTNNPLYYKTSVNTWVQVGSTAWQNSRPTVTGTNANGVFTTGHNIIINTVAVAVPAAPDANLAGFVNVINTASNLPGVTAAVVNGIIQIYVTSAAKSAGVGAGLDADGVLIISAGPSSGSTLLASLGIEAGTYGGITTAFSTNTGIPQWRTGVTGVISRPTGSVWIKTNSANLGASITLRRYNLSTDVFTDIAVPLYANDWAAIAGLDASGGKLLPTNSVYAQYNVTEDGKPTYKLFRRTSSWPTKIVGTVTTPTFASLDAFTVRVSTAGSTALTSAVTVALAATTAAEFVSKVNAAQIPNLTAAIESTGAVSLTHALGGVIVLANSVSTPLEKAGFVAATGVRAGNSSNYIASNWTALTYTVDSVEPSTQPDDDTLWYYSSIDQVDIMVHDGTRWKGYRNVTSDARGYNLSLTNASGVIVSASKPTTQTNGNPLVTGDLWLDTSDLENYPKLSRWQLGSGVYRWVAIDNSDQSSESGIVFADARWDTNGLTDPITADFVTTTALLSSDYLDIDAPLASAYPRGTLLFNTRRSGFNVKKYMGNYYNADDFNIPSWSNSTAYALNDKVIYTNGIVYKAIASVSAGTVPTNTASWAPLEPSAWVSAAGNRTDGSPYMGRHAVRAIIVEALKAAIDVSSEIREEQREFTLIATPGYPELIPNMVALNNDRANTAFIVADSPMRLAPTGVDIQAWSAGKNTGVLADDTLTTSDPYTAVYYPAALANDLSGNTIAVPTTHMALRAIMRSDNASYPWFAPAGTSRGLVDNATSLGYVNSASGEFVSFGLPVGLRDTLYEAKINPITYLPGSGITVYGQKTINPVTSALDRVNVARLVAYLRDRLNKLSRPFLFEPNDKITRDQIKQITEQMLNDLVAKRALYDYLVVCDTTNNTPVRIDRNELWLDIAIEPVKAVEFIYIPVRIKNTGAISGTV